MFISEKVQAILEREHLLAGNIPKQIWLYDADFEKSAPSYIKNEYKLISKYCGVFETRGDRRAGTHLFQGVTILLMLLEMAHSKAIDHKKISDLFPRSRFFATHFEPNVLPVPYAPPIPSTFVKRILQEGGI